MNSRGSCHRSAHLDAPAAPVFVAFGVGILAALHHAVPCLVQGMLGDLAPARVRFPRCAGGGHAVLSDCRDLMLPAQASARQGPLVLGALPDERLSTLTYSLPQSQTSRAPRRPGRPGRGMRTSASMTTPRPMRWSSSTNKVVCGIRQEYRKQGTAYGATRLLRVTRPRCRVLAAARRGRRR